MDVHCLETRTDHRAIEAVGFRHWECRCCALFWHTVETVLSVRPESRWLSRQIATTSEMVRTGEMDALPVAPAR
jgi:hypothetical protein